MAAVGSTAERGTVLYRADDEPVAVLIADSPWLRDLERGVDDGADVLALEFNLVALGYGSDLTVDATFDRATASAVEEWEEDLGRAEPDGVVTIGEVILLARAAKVLAHDAEVGDRLAAGSPVVTVGAESQVAETSVDATAVAQWEVGTVVELTLTDGEEGSGTVIEVGRDESGGAVDLVVALARPDTGRPVGSEVDIVRTVEQHPEVVTLPVAAVVAAADGSPAVRLVDGGTDRVVEVSLGIAADGRIEITEGLEPGAEVRLPA